ncbi:MAG: hypothetical protein JJU06_01780 [Ectothiorhodospiraceae bacterium]|nr:hypothetical protein [Ectothiorhodospiraceae bacterium]MCH8503701.1 hypothetical protein [Ectothiorhodospiraceae bacterium]
MTRGHLFSIALAFVLTALAVLAAIPALRLQAQQAETPQTLVALFWPLRPAAEANRDIVEAGGIPVRRTAGGLGWVFIATEQGHAREVEKRGALVLAPPAGNAGLVGCAATVSAR